MIEAYDKTNQTFGRWTIIEELGNDKVLCRCSCGTVKINSKYNVVNGRTQSCGCLSSELKKKLKTNIVGKTFNDWTVDKELGGGRVLCTCSCGVQKVCVKSSITSGKSKSCGHNTNKFKSIEGTIINEWTILKEMGYGYVQCRCSCGTEAILKKATILRGSSKSCGCKKQQLMTNTLMQKYGEVTANKIKNPRELWQIEALQSYEGLANTIRQAYGSKKPTIKQLVLLLDANEASIGRSLRSLNAYDLVDIAPKSSEKEREIANYISTIYTGKIEYNVRCIVKQYELDIYLPDRKLAIEFNGNYWHSDVNKDANYHQRKTIEFAKHGIQIIHIFEYEWDDIELQNKLKIYLRDILGDTQRIFAKNTYVKETTYTEVKQFEDENHLSGSTYSEINLGMYFESQLIGIATFGKPRFDKNAEYELIRLCFKQGIRVVGGSEKLFKYFVSKYKPNNIISYCDISKFKGSVYIKLGFKSTTDMITRPGYIWFNLETKQILSRYNTQKSKISSYNDGETETNIMENNGFVKIHNAGNLKFIWKS